jgi:hypothetical protein
MPWRVRRFSQFSTLPGLNLVNCERSDLIQNTGQGSAVMAKAGVDKRGKQDKLKGWHQIATFLGERFQLFTAGQLRECLSIVKAVPSPRRRRNSTYGSGKSQASPCMLPEAPPTFLPS